MFAVRCPRCGAPTPATLAAPDRLHCRSCAYAGPPAPEDAARLAHAATVLFGLDRRGRQLDAAQRRLLGSVRYRRAAVVFSVVLALLAISPCALVALLAMVTETPSYTTALGCGTPVAALGLTGAVLIALALGRRRGLEEACAARPPAEPGQPAGCHVCGAPLPGGGLENYVVRCTFCQADNVVDPRVLARLGQSRLQALEHVDRAVQREAASLRRGALVSRVVLVGTLLASPAFCCLGGYTAQRIDGYVDAAPDTALEYVLVRGDTEELPCVARVSGRFPDGTGYLVRRGSADSGGTSAYLPGAASEPTFDVTWLVGRQVRYGAGVGVVRAVRGSVMEPTNAYAEVESDRGATVRVRAGELCLLAPPEPTVLRWHRGPTSRRRLPAGTPRDDPRIAAHLAAERVPALRPPDVPGVEGGAEDEGSGP